MEIHHIPLIPLSTSALPFQPLGAIILLTTRAQHTGKGIQSHKLFVPTYACPHKAGTTTAVNVGQNRKTVAILIPPTSKNPVENLVGSASRSNSAFG